MFTETSSFRYNPFYVVWRTARLSVRRRDVKLNEGDSTCGTNAGHSCPGLYVSWESPYAQGVACPQSSTYPPHLAPQPSLARQAPSARHHALQRCRDGSIYIVANSLIPSPVRVSEFVSEVVREEGGVPVGEPVAKGGMEGVNDGRSECESKLVSD